MKLTRSFFLALALLVAFSAIVPKAVAQIPCGGTINPRQTLSVNWTEYRFDAKHSGCNPYEHIVNASNVGSLQIKWQSATQAPLGRSPALVNGSLYVESYALNAATGALLWDTGLDVTCEPTVVNGVEYIGGGLQNPALYAFDATNGKFRWLFLTGGPVYSSPTVVNGVVYFGSSDWNVYALNATTGAMLWSYKTQDWITSSPAVVNGVVYIGSQDHNLYALDANTGALRWKYMTFGQIQSAPSVAGNTVYFGSSSPDLNMYAVNATTGALVWRSQMNPIGNGATSNSPAVANGLVYIADQYEYLYAYNAGTGAQVWSYSPGPINLLNATPAVANGVVYMTNVLFSSVLAIDARTGTLLWSYEATGGSQPVSPPILANGTLYVAGQTGDIHNPTGVAWAFHLPGQ